MTLVERVVARWLPDLLVVSGMGLTFYGFWSLHEPLGYIALGLKFSLLGYLAIRSRVAARSESG